MLNTKLILYMRNLIFGAEDSLVSTVGLLSGIAAGGIPKGTIILTGVVLIFVEAFSMGVGSYLSEYSVEESERGGRFRPKGARSAAVIMFLSYLISGLIPLWPYLFFDITTALIVSITNSLFGLFALGYISAMVLKIRIFNSALRMLFIGGAAIALGMAVGRIVSA